MLFLFLLNLLLFEVIKLLLLDDGLFFSGVSVLEIILVEEFLLFDIANAPAITADSATIINNAIIVFLNIFTLSLNLSKYIVQFEEYMG